MDRTILCDWHLPIYTMPDEILKEPCEICSLQSKIAELEEQRVYLDDESKENFANYLKSQRIIKVLMAGIMLFHQQNCLQEFQPKIDFGALQTALAQADQIEKGV